MGIRPFSWGKFGIVPDPPEPIECDGEFEEDKCQFCSEYKNCKETENEDINTDAVLQRG